ncbi:MAG: SPOR domain-containing protein [Legionellaceae bacterium]|nr:SPOR domain-containing protein [Legionellaceae bacterium]
MATKSGTKKMGRKNSSGVGSLMLAFIAFVFGYLFATVFDFNHMSSWVSSQISSDDSVKSAANDGSVKKHRPMPKLEFYTLLSQDTGATKQSNPSPSPDVNIPKDINTTKNLPLHEPLVKENKASKPVVANVSKDKYLLQLGSFKSRSEADKMRAELVMKGFDVWITTLNQDNVNWYRVMTGPFTTRVEAQKLQITFSRLEHINGMVRKMEV